MKLFPGPTEHGWCTVLQLTALLFFLPALVAYEKGFVVGTYIYSANGFVSIVVHRGSRSAEFDVVDLMDHICIFFWIAYNCLLYYIAIESPITYDLLYAFLAAIAVLGTRMWLKTLEWRSFYRYVVHGFMHCFGCVGSLYLLRAAQDGY